MWFVLVESTDLISDTDFCIINSDIRSRRVYGACRKKAVCEMEYSVLFIINPVLFKRLLQLTKSEIK